MSQEHLEARRAEILEGARRAFARHGYDGTTVARLEAEIGLSRGAIFHYFESKLDLFAELARADNERYQRLLTEEGIEAVIRAIATADRDWLTVLVETEVRLWHDAEFERRMETSQQNDEEMYEALARGQAEGRLRSDLPLADLAEFLLVVINGLAVRVAGEDSPNIDAFVRLVNDAVSPR